MNTSPHVISSEARNLTRRRAHIRLPAGKVGVRSLVALMLLGMTMWGTFLIPTPAQAINWNPFASPGFGSGPIKEDLSAEIISGGQQAAVVGIGEEILNEVDIRLYAMRIVREALGFVGLILVIFILYGGFLYMTSQGNDEKIDKAKQVLSRAAIGTFIILTSYSIVVFVNRSLQRALSEQMVTQAQHCSTSTGQATCCQEWNAYQTSLTQGVSVGQALINPFQGTACMVRATDCVESDSATDALYNRWKDCFDKSAEGAGLDSNIFD